MNMKIVSKNDIVGLSKLRFAVVNVRSRIVLSLHHSVEGADIQAQDYNKHLNFDDTDLFEVVEVSDME